MLQDAADACVDALTKVHYCTVFLFLIINLLLFRLENAFFSTEIIQFYENLNFDRPQKPAMYRGNRDINLH